MTSRATVLLAFVVFSVPASAAELSRAQYLMGTVCEITAAADAAQFEGAFAEAARVERLLSTWRDDSELSAVNRGAKPSPELRLLLQRVIALRDETGGAFEPQIRPLIDAWETRGGGHIASKQSIAAALSQIRSGHAPFEEGAFGKGYAIDRMLARIDAPRVVINFGGQIAVRGESRVAIADPLHRDVPLLSVMLRDSSISTSSGSEKSFTIGGRRYTHIIDPHSGEPLPARGSVSVIARDAFTADVLSTALYVMGTERGLRWADDHRVAALFITDAHAVLKSKYFPKD